MMKGERWKVIYLVIQIVSWFCITSSIRPFLDPDYVSPCIHQPSGSGTVEKSQTLGINVSSEKVINGTSTFKGVLLGSSPPRCEHRCHGCSPCEATQVPTTKAHLQIQFANYEPEGWKCKCGPYFYTP